MPRTSARMNMQDSQAANSVEPQAGRQSSHIPQRGQGRYHPYKTSTITKGNLGKPTVFKVSSGGRKDHPDWPFKGVQYKDVELISSDGISFWVHPFTLMAFSKALCSRIETENQQRSTSGGSANTSMTLNAPHSRRLPPNNASRRIPANDGQAQHIIIDCKRTHHRVLETFLSFTQARFNAIELQTAAQYSECAAFALSHETPHFKDFLVVKVLPKVMKEDPMGTFAYACETGNEELMKECFPYMGNHWCITVDSNNAIPAWNTYANTVYAIDTPMRCADAFASKIGLAKFRAFLFACDRALDAASASVATGNQGQLKFSLEGDEYMIEDKPVWEMIYRETMAFAELNGEGNDIPTWVDDIHEAPIAVTPPPSMTPPPPMTETEVSSVPATPHAHQPPNRQVQTADVVRINHISHLANSHRYGQDQYDQRDSMDDVEAAASGDGDPEPAVQSDDYQEDQDMAQVQA